MKLVKVGKHVINLDAVRCAEDDGKSLTLYFDREHTLTLQDDQAENLRRWLKVDISDAGPLRY